MVRVACFCITFLSGFIDDAYNQTKKFDDAYNWDDLSEGSRLTYIQLEDLTNSCVWVYSVKYNHENEKLSLPYHASWIKSMVKVRVVGLYPTFK